MATAFRGNLQPLLKHAQYLDDLWLENVPNQCFASCWALENGEKLVILANDSTQDVSFRMKDLHGSIVKDTKSMDTAIQDSSMIGTDPITITVPQGQLSYFLLQWKFAAPIAKNNRGSLSFWRNLYETDCVR